MIFIINYAYKSVKSSLVAGSLVFLLNTFVPFGPAFAYSASNEAMQISPKKNASLLEEKVMEADISQFPFNKEFQEHIKSSIPKQASANLSKNQVLVANLPAYRLTLYTLTEEGKIEEYSIPVSIGRGRDGRKQTPVSVGIIYEKRPQVVFRYGSSHPELNIKKDDLIKWTNTYDSQGNPKSYKMPYDKMRGLGMKLWTSPSGKQITDFVIHSTTDEFTLGTFASGGCLRVGMDDMLELYKRVAAANGSGAIINPVPIVMNYNLVEITSSHKILLHADVYGKGISTVDEFVQAVLNHGGLNINDYDLLRVKEKFDDAQKGFAKAGDDILKKLAKSFPKNYLPEELRSQLHQEYSLEEFLKPTNE